MTTKTEKTEKTDDKKRPDIRATISDDCKFLELEFAEGYDALYLHIDDLSDSIRAYGLMHGLKAKLIDAAALSRNTTTGRSASIKEKWEAVCIVMDRLKAGQWNAPRGEGGTSGGGLLFQALCRVYPDRDPSDLREWLASKDKKAQAALRKNARIAQAIADIVQAAADDGGEDMLDELDSMD